MVLSTDREDGQMDGRGRLVECVSSEQIGEGRVGGQITGGWGVGVLAS